jgi:tetratricopeptide (TPR) repeat protein
VGDSEQEYPSGPEVLEVPISNPIEGLPDRRVKIINIGGQNMRVRTGTGNYMGIFKKLLHKEKKAAGHSDAAPTDILHPGDSYNRAEDLPGEQPTEREPGREEIRAPEPKLIPKGTSVMDVLSPKRIPEPAPVPAPPPSRMKAEAPKGLLGMLADAGSKIASAERMLAEIERFLPQPGAILTEVKIAILETKIKLAELEIQFALLDAAPADRSRILGDVHKVLYDVERKIGDAEQKIQNVVISDPRARMQLVELKIVLSEAKITCFQLKIALEKTYGAGPQIIPPAEKPPEHVAVPAPVPVRQVPPAPEPVPAPEPAFVRRTEPEVPPSAPVPSPAPLPRLPRVEAPMMKKPQFGQDRGKPSLEAEPIDALKFGVDLPDTEKDESVIVREKVRIAAKPVDIVQEEGHAAMGKEVSVPDERGEQRPESMSTIDRMRILQSEMPPGTAVIQKPAVTDVEGGRIQIIARDSDRTLVIEDFIKKGMEMRKQEKFEDAILYFDRVLEMDPENEIAMNNKGVALRKMGRFQEAEVCFDKVLTKNDTNASVWYNKSFVLFKLGRFEEALASFDRCIDLDPGNATAWNGKGKVLQKLGRIAEAEQSFATARELGFPS